MSQYTPEQFKWACETPAYCIEREMDGCPDRDAIHQILLEQEYEEGQFPLSPNRSQS